MAKKFWTFIGNDKYDIGLTGSSVHVYDKNGIELATFKDLTYAYKAAISPLGDIFVVKTTDGRMAIYSFEPLKLVKKFRFSKIDGGQDDNMIFSPDGKFFYNIERHINSLLTALTVYETDNFTLVKQLLLNDERYRLSAIEYDEKSKTYYILGGLCNENSKYSHKDFVAKLSDDNLEEVRFISESQGMFYTSFIRLKQSGFTKKGFEWSLLNYISDNENSDTSFEFIKKSNYSLATLWENASTTTIEKKD